MHEMGIAMQIVEICTASIPKEAGDIRVARINLEVGKLSAIVPESLTFCFQIAAQGTPLEGAELNIEEIPVEAVCRKCGHRFTIENPAFSCPSCSDSDIQMISGRELDIKSIEIPDEGGS